MSSSSLVKLGRWTEAERLLGDLADLLDDPTADDLLARYWGCAMTRQGRLEEARPHIANVRAILDRTVRHEEPHGPGAAVVEFDHADGRPNVTVFVDDLLTRANGSLESTVELVLAGVTALADQHHDFAATPRDRSQAQSVATAERWVERLGALAVDGLHPGPGTQLFADAAVAQLTRLRDRAEPERWAQVASSRSSRRTTTTSGGR